MNKIYQFIAASLLLTVTASIICMEQPRTPRIERSERHVAKTPAYWSMEFIDAINNEQYNDAIGMLDHLSHFPIAMHCLALAKREMTSDNILYSRTNLDRAFLGPIHHDNLWYFAYGITRNGQKPTRSAEANAYFKAAQDRLEND